MVVVRQHTDHVAGLPMEMGGSGDPSPVTAYGVFCGIQAAVAFRQTQRYDPQASLKGLTAAVQGLGNVGFSLCSHLHAAGAKLIVADISESSVQRACDQFSATPVDPDSIYSADADVFVPSALGGILNSDTVSQLKTTMVVGAANNQLAEPSVARLLTDRKILYAPDYVTNAGGIINISLEEGGYDRQKALSLTEQIGSTLTEVFERARLAQKTTAEIADFMARRLLNKTSD
jgi:leucine dehydrogenase